MTDGIKGPWLLLGGIGVVLGLLLAMGYHLLAGWLRRNAPLPFAVVGWLVAATVAGLAIFCLINYLKGDDPTGIGMGVGFLSLLALGCVAALAALTGKRDGVGWPQSFGHLMALTAAAFLLIYVLAQNLAGIAAFLRGGSPTDGNGIDFFAYVHFSADWLYGTLLATLVLLETFRPFRGILMGSTR